ncbi:hypothetical protein HT031_003673 [Scenedesmus sp. PABB004]|nr:hypothetical protein HT031_003673 [Scenedesmus sp. PABB004]
MPGGCDPMQVDADGGGGEQPAGSPPPDGEGRSGAARANAARASAGRGAARGARRGAPRGEQRTAGGSTARSTAFRAWCDGPDTDDLIAAARSACEEWGGGDLGGSDCERLREEYWAAMRQSLPDPVGGACAWPARRAWLRRRFGLPPDAGYGTDDEGGPGPGAAAAARAEAGPAVAAQSAAAEAAAAAAGAEASPAAARPARWCRTAADAAPPPAAARAPAARPRSVPRQQGGAGASAAAAGDAAESSGHPARRHGGASGLAAAARAAAERSRSASRRRASAGAPVAARSRSPDWCGGARAPAAAASAAAARARSAPGQRGNEVAAEAAAGGPRRSQRPGLGTWSEANRGFAPGWQAGESPASPRRRRGQPQDARAGRRPGPQAPSIEYCDTVGRLLRVGWRTQHGDRLSVLGVYAPSERAERPAFFAGPYQEALLAGPAGALLLAGGDFNCVVSPADVQPLPGQAAARSGRCHGGADLARANAAAGVVDALLRVAPQLRAQPTHYQRRDGAVHGGRIDAWFVAQELADHWLVGAAHHPLCHSDHRPVSVSLQRPGQPLAGRRRWTFPNDLLACASRRAELRDRVAAAARQLRDAGLDPGELFEQLKQSVRRIAAELRAEMRQQEQQELHQLRHALRAARWAAGSQQYGCPEAAANALAAERALAAAEAAQRRQQADALEAVWDECGEGPSRWFHRLGRAPGGAQPIHALARPGQPAVPLTSRAGIQEGGRIIADFFDADVPGGMFGVRPTDQQQQDCMLDALDRQLSATEQRACRGQDPEGLLTDGLTCEAYAALWEVLGEPLVQAFNYHYLNQAAGAPQLAATQRLGLITLIHKGGQPREAVSSYRPITLLNTDTKIAAKAIVQRLAPALGSIVDCTQTAFVPGRDIADNVLMHLEAIDHARETRAPGCLLFLDFAKAYDRLDRGWLFRCLARMGLPDATTRWVRLLLAGTRARVAFNGGHVSREFSVASGCAQGSPLSPLLYVLAAQPLAAMCRRVQRQPGFASLQLPGGAGPAPCCHQHADDTTLHAASVESAKRLLDGAVAPFCLASGAQLNLAKCKGMLLGDHPALQLQPDGSGQLVECSTGVCFPDTEQAPIRHLGVLLSATGVERHAAQLYRERLRTITCRIAHWSRYALTRPGRRHVARQVLAACVGWHAQFVPVPADLLRLIQRRVTAYIVGNWCIRESDNRIIRQVPRAAIACLPASMGGEAQVDVAAFTTAMLAKTAARLLHPVGAAWKPPAAARFARALPGRGTAALVQGTALELRAQLPWRWGAIACAFAALGVHRVIPHGSMTVEQIRVEALVGNCSVGAALGGARIASLEDLPAELRSDSLGQAAPRLPWRPAADGVVMPGEWQQALARSGPSAPGWQALRPSAAPPSPGGGVVQQPQQPLAALPVEQPPQPPPPPPAVRWVRRWALGAAAASFFEPEANAQRAPKETR